MKLAILGKGGSGKSSVSWLLSNFLSQDKNHQTLAIDADHNMDLSSSLNFETDDINYFKDFNSEFRKIAGMKQDGMWKEYFNFSPVHFQYPNDPRLNNYIYNISPKLDLMVEGLGDKNLMHSNKCSHSYSAPLKYMLPTLELKENSWVVLDSVAGTDMMNYGLYFGFDVLIVVVEGHTNSIKVAKQIKSLADRQGLRLYFVLNKFNQENQLISDFMLQFKDFILGKIASDLGILEYKYKSVNSQTKKSLEDIYNQISMLPKNTDSIKKLQEFEKLKI